MLWKQFFTPVTSIDAIQAKKLVTDEGADNVTFLDVRQPNEYANFHIPGAYLVPLGELDKRLGELDPKKPVVVYCAIGGRSRVAAQMMAGKGFTKLYNLSGGIKGWNSEVAMGSPELGLEIFSGAETPEQTIIIGYGLEQGLRDFYLEMQKNVTSQKAKDLFQMLADIELQHEKQLVKLYKEMTGSSISEETFQTDKVQPAMEGGLTTEQYLERFSPDLESELDILSLAISIEGQALDLYQRASNRAEQENVKTVLRHIANEERGHIKKLTEYLDAMA
jgi:rhodanese-related sulfurtransferase/rubrerythrin